MMPFLNVHTHDPHQAEGVQSILSLSVGHDDLSALNSRPVAVGIHPWFIGEDNIQFDLGALSALVSNPHVKMIGECGLDKIKGANFELQVEVFEAQMQLAKSTGKPLILHCVKAYDEMIAMAKRINPQVGMVVHGFNKSEQLGKQLIAQGFSLSFGKVILNEQSGAATLVRESENFLLETDDSNIQIAEIYEAAAKLKNTTVDELKALIFANWKNLNLI